MSDGNKKRDWKVFESLYFRLLKHYERILKSESQRNIIKEIVGQNIKLIDKTKISQCLKMFGWAATRTFLLIPRWYLSLLRLPKQLWL